MATKQVSLSHAFRGEETFTYGELVEVTVFDRGPSAMSDEFKDESDLLVRVLRGAEGCRLLGLGQVCGLYCS